MVSSATWSYLPPLYPDSTDPRRPQMAEARDHQVVVRGHGGQHQPNGSSEDCQKHKEHARPQEGRPDFEALAAPLRGEGLGSKKGQKNESTKTYIILQGVKKKCFKT